MVEPDRIFVKDGSIWSSAGVTAGIDLALALIAEDLGEAIARLTAKQLVVYYRRPGGQSQFSELLELAPARGRFGALLDFVRTHLHEPLSVEHLACHAAMSPRNFARAFRAETGITPAKAVERLRAEAARAELESGASSVQVVAQKCGFGDPERLRRSLIRLYGAPPSAWKRSTAEL
jgi:transcriptional regulator GlxA family with amidase domain